MTRTFYDLSVEFEQPNIQVRNHIKNSEKLLELSDTYYYFVLYYCTHLKCNFHFTGNINQLISQFQPNMSLDEIRDKGHGSVDAAKEAFDELCAMVEALHVSLLQNLESISYCYKSLLKT